MKLLFSVFFFLLNFTLLGQNIDYSWEKLDSFPLRKEAIWVVDNLENQYISDNSVLTKKDTSQSFVYQQSIKSWGATSQIIPVNAFKIIQFSEEQQTICYFDNTLTETEDCIDLSNYNIVNAKWISGSAQPNKIWVFDNMNSTLSLLSLNQLGQSQQVRNLNGLLDVENVIQLLEAHNRLYVVDEKNGIFMFDIYGTLLFRFNITGSKSIQATEDVLMVQTNDDLHIIALADKHSSELLLPISNVRSMVYQNSRFFFRTDRGVVVFSLKVNSRKE